MQIFVLTTIINGRKNYVAKLMSNHSRDNKKIVNYTTEPVKAKDFGDADSAIKFISRINNPHERHYIAEVVEVDETQWQHATELQESDLQ